MALGALQGPTELLPVSSSGHLSLIPELLGRPNEELDPELLKAFEVALHAGTAAALLIALRGEIALELRGLTARRALHAVLAFAPPAAAGLLLERPIERRLGGPRSVAGAQVVAGLLLAIADRRPATRGRRDASSLDHLLMGIAQAAALAPGVSRNGASLTVLRARRLRHRTANELSRHAALPIIVGATALKGTRLARRGVPPEFVAALGAGTAASFVSTLGSAPLIRVMDGAGSYLAPAVYRVLLGAYALLARRRLNA